MKTLRLIAAAAAVCMVVVGCASFEQHKDVAQLGITYGTLKFIEKAGDGEAQAARAAKVREITLDVKKYASGESVTIEALQAAVIARLPASLTLADRVLAQALVDAVMAELRARVAGNLISPDQLLAVNQVAGWIVSAADLAVPPTS